MFLFFILSIRINGTCEAPSTQPVLGNGGTPFPFEDVNVWTKHHL